MTSTITVRDINPSDKAWLQREARHFGVSVEEFVRRLIREKCRRSAKPSEAFKRFCGPEHGVELPARPHYGYKPVTFDEETET